MPGKTDQGAPKRTAHLERKTKETEIRVALTLDGQGKASVSTGIAFLDHMFTLLAAHGFIDLDLKASGDIDVDYHHTVEDLGICFGSALNKALAKRVGLRRFGEAMVPMDEALARVVLDLSNRPYLSYNVDAKRCSTGTFDIGLLKEFFRAICIHSGMNLHIDLIRGEDPHHISEAIFKAFARALDMASSLDERRMGMVPSTKGVL
ncbi:MAG: imidazoleglycerol-phosphate dehydratase HisB [Deltaproteobacteria bacterium]|nr:MAG: imidazoleglycerol-phosphate dehydratase HisB [Deltaproteobacteria bacterium]